MQISIQEIFIKGRIFIIHLVLVLDKDTAIDGKGQEFILPFVIKDGRLQMENDHFAKICAAKGITDKAGIEAMIYHELVLFLLEHERQYQWINPHNQILRRNLLYYMKEKRMTIADVANEADITEDEIQGILSGDTITTDILLKLCLAFRVNTNCLLFKDVQAPGAE